MMNFFWVLLFIAGVCHESRALDCYVCTASKYVGLDSGDATQLCYSPTASTTKVTCPATATGTVAYCSAIFKIVDGIVVDVARACNVDTSAPAVSEYCAAAINSGVWTNDDDVDTTTCKYSCSSDNCNSQKTTSLTACTSNCSASMSGGYCDYIVGTCVCNSGFSGSDCSTTSTTTSTTLNCVQCNSEVDTSCNTTTTATACESDQSYCYSAQTWLLDESNTIRKNTITRGCTSQYVAADECSFSNNADAATFNVNEYFEYTCVSTCNTAGCNTDYPDGTVNGNEKKGLECVQCTFDRNSEITDSCSSLGTRTPCSDTTATHCSAVVTYWISDRNDLNHNGATPDYELVKVERSCATAALTTQCTTSPVLHLHFNQTTCQETCDYDGCNTGWPARPQCFICITDTTDIMDGYDVCKEKPSVASDCIYPYEGYCGIEETRLDNANVDGHYYQMKRSCMYRDIGNGCSTSTIGTYNYKTCNVTCTENFCNQGSGAANIAASLTMLLLPALVLQWT